MTPSPPLPAPNVLAVRNRIDALSTRVHDALNKIRHHAPVTLKGLEDEIETLCLAVREPDCAADETVRDGMAELLGTLDAMETALVEKRDVLTTGTAPTPVAPQVAASAYGKTKP